MHRGSSKLRRGADRGVALLMTLILVGAVSASAAGVASQWLVQAQREAEEQLLLVGDQYAKAIAAYYYATPGASKQLPRSLSDLLEDTRSGTLRRHLRALYPDPTAPSTPWALIRDASGGIVGVHSTNSRAPWRQVETQLTVVRLAPATRLSDWKFAPNLR